MNRLDLIIDALSVTQNSVWSKLNEKALAAARELQAIQPEPFKPDWVSYRQGVADGAAQSDNQEPVCDKDPSLCGFTLCQLAKVCKHTPRNTMPTKIFAPNLEQILNAAGFYRREWVGLSDTEAAIYGNQFSGTRLVREIEAVLKERNND